MRLRDEANLATRQTDGTLGPEVSFLALLRIHARGQQETVLSVFPMTPLEVLQALAARLSRRGMKGLVGKPPTGSKRPSVAIFRLNQEQRFSHLGEAAPLARRLAFPAGLGAEHRSEAQTLQGQCDGLRGTVRARARDLEGLPQRHKGLALQRSANEIDQRVGQVRQVAPTSRS